MATRWRFIVFEQLNLQGAVAAVEVVKTRGENELFIHTPQSLRRGQAEDKKISFPDLTSFACFIHHCCF